MCQVEQYSHFIGGLLMENRLVRKLTSSSEALQVEIRRLNPKISHRVVRSGHHKYPKIRLGFGYTHRTCDRLKHEGYAAFHFFRCRV